MNRRLSPEDLLWLRKSCTESGVPEKVTDPVVVTQAAAILKPNTTLPSGLGRAA